MNACNLLLITFMYRIINIDFFLTWTMTWNLFRVNFLHDLIHCQLYYRHHCPLGRMNFVVFVSVVCHQFGICVAVGLQAVSLSMVCLPTLLVKFQTLEMKSKSKPLEPTDSELQMQIKHTMNDGQNVSGFHFNVFAEWKPCRFQAVRLCSLQW